MVNDATLLQSLDDSTNSPLTAPSTEIWQRLQDEKLMVSQSLLDGGQLFQDHAVGSDSEISHEVTHELDWRHRERLERRLRQLTEAQDRLLEGHFGLCGDCEKPIAPRRLAVDPAVEFCFACQTVTDFNKRFRSL